jgi:hypothetical protein
VAYITETNNSFGASISNALSTFGTAFAAFFLDLSNAGQRSQMMEELQAMDDATLKATHGITRSQIVSYVFRDKLVP